VLILAGLDPSGGAGLLADAEAVRAAGARPLCVATALTAQTTRHMHGFQPLAPALAVQTAEALIEEEPVRAIKVGMVGTSAMARAIAGLLGHAALPAVVDPVLAASSGAALFQGGPAAAREAYGALWPHAVITPNAPAETPYDIIACPAGGYSPVTPELAAVGYTGNGVLNLASGTTLNLTAGKQYFFKSVTMTGTASPRKQYFFKSVTMTGTSKLALPGGGPVDFQVQDSIYMAGGSIANTNHKATDLSFSACGTPTDPSKGNYWGVTGGADAFFSVYAPNHVVYALGNSAFYGAVISSIFYITGSAQFHYDEALARKASPNLQVQRATWGQFAGN